jgi:predicted oxidoreductase
VEAPTLQALCGQLEREGIPAVTLLAEIERYNQAGRAGKGAGLTPARQENAVVLERPPFYALRCVAAITATCGGIAVDAQCRVLDEERRPISGLHAVGVDAGGIWGKTYGGFLSWSLVSGRRAGAEAARHARASV